jgi:hypothetical protein
LGLEDFLFVISWGYRVQVHAILYHRDLDLAAVVVVKNDEPEVIDNLALGTVAVMLAVVVDVERGRVDLARSAPLPKNLSVEKNRLLEDSDHALKAPVLNCWCDCIWLHVEHLNFENLGSCLRQRQCQPMCLMNE